MGNVGLEGVPREERAKIVGSNAAELYNLDLERVSKEIP